MSVHVSVLVTEVLDYLAVEPGKKYIDATVGAGGHSLEIINAGGIVLGLDVDQAILDHARLKLGDRAILKKANYSQIDEIATRLDFAPVDGILFDLGVSSLQLDSPERGFSFRYEAPLDMRMDNSLPVRALDLINGLHKGELTELFTKLGEEPYAKVIARKIVESREHKKIETTTELASLVESVKKRSFSKKHIHPATQIFQALRIAVNDELNTLREALPKAADLLVKEGRLVVMSFHSLEDRIVKEFINSRPDLRSLTPESVSATEQEIRTNPRARSAKLRAVIKH